MRKSLGLLLIPLVFSYAQTGDACECFSCEDCQAAVDSGTCRFILLNGTLSGSPCINVNGKENLTFSCAKPIGTVNEPLISLNSFSNITIQNCELSAGWVIQAEQGKGLYLRNLTVFRLLPSGTGISNVEDVVIENVESTDTTCHSTLKSVENLTLQNFTSHHSFTIKESTDLFLRNLNFTSSGISQIFEITSYRGHLEMENVSMRISGGYLYVSRYSSSEADGWIRGVEVILDTNPQIKSTYLFQLDFVENFTVENVWIEDQSNSKSYGGIGLTSVKNVTLRNATVITVGGGSSNLGGILVYHVVNLTLEDVYVFNPGSNYGLHLATGDNENVTVRNLTVEGGRFGVYFGWPGGTAINRNVWLDLVRVKDAEYGIQMEKAQNVYLTNANITGTNTSEGVVIKESSVYMENVSACGIKQGSNYKWGFNFQTGSTVQGRHNFGTVRSSVAVPPDFAEPICPLPPSPENNTEVGINAEFRVRPCFEADSCTLHWRNQTEESKAMENQGEEFTASVRFPHNGFYEWWVICSGVLPSGNPTTETTFERRILVKEVEIDLLAAEKDALVGTSVVEFGWLAEGEENQSLECTLYVDGIPKNTTTSQSGEETWVRTEVAHGKHVWKVECSTPNNLTGISEERNLTVDLLPPVVDLLSPENGGLLGTSSVELRWKATDDSSPLACSVFVDGSLVYTNSSVENDTEASATVSVAEGSHVWNVSCEDPASNVGHSTTWAFEVDTTPPEVHLLSPANGSMVEEDPLEVVSLAEDPHLFSNEINLSGPVQILLSCPVGGNSSRCSQNFSALPLGEYRITALACDELNHCNHTWVRVLYDTAVLTAEPISPGRIIAPPFKKNLSCYYNSSWKLAEIRLRVSKGNWSFEINSSVNSSEAYLTAEVEFPEFGEYLLICEAEDPLGKSAQTSQWMQVQRDEEEEERPPKFDVLIEGEGTWRRINVECRGKPSKADVKIAGPEEFSFEGVSEVVLENLTPGTYWVRVEGKCRTTRISFVVSQRTEESSTEGESQEVSETQTETQGTAPPEETSQPAQPSLGVECLRNSDCEQTEVCLDGKCTDLRVVLEGSLPPGTDLRVRVFGGELPREFLLQWEGRNYPRGHLWIPPKKTSLPSLLLKMFGERVKVDVKHGGPSTMVEVVNPSGKVVQENGLKELSFALKEGGDYFIGLYQDGRLVERRVIHQEGCEFLGVRGHIGGVCWYWYAAGGLLTMGGLVLASHLGWLRSP